MQLRAAVFLLAFAGSLNVYAQCAPSASPTHFCPPSLVTNSSEQRAEFYSFERPGRAPFKVGLALSGGGTRAGYFAHGVLQGLNDAGVLEHVDVMSTVSGGGYATYWYMRQRYAAKNENRDYRTMFADCFPQWIAVGHRDDAPLKAVAQWQADSSKAKDQRLPKVCGADNSVHFVGNDDYRWQAYLGRYPVLFDSNPKLITGDPQDRGFFKNFTFDRVVKLLRSSLDLFHRNSKVSLVGDWYEEGIYRVWGINPAPRPGANMKDGVETAYSWKSTPGKQLDTFQDLRDLTTSDLSVPLWILNGRINQKTEEPVPDSIFEMSPYSYGSGHGYEKGFMPDDQKVTLGRATRMSAAFMDPQGAIKSSSVYKLAKAGNAIFPKVAEWGLDLNLPALDSKPMHVSDGGGEENLGVYTLIRRGVPNIIIVDGEQDPMGTLDGLCRVKKAISGTHRLNIDNLENLDKVCEPVGGIIRGYNTSDWKNPVMHGTIERVIPSGMADPPTQIWYIKLGWDELHYYSALKKGQCETDVSDVSCFLAIYYGENSEAIDKGDKYMLFPQIDTVGMTARASSYLFWAYRELGREAGRRLAWNSVSQSLQRREPAAECLQASMGYEKRGARIVSRPGSKVTWQPCKPVTK